MQRKIEQNLGLATDLLLHAEIGVVAREGPYVVMRTPEAPDYFAGNTLVLEHRPSNDERERLEADFGRLVGAPPAIAHRGFSWPEDAARPADFDAYVVHGYSASMCSVLVAERAGLHPAAINPAVQVRLFESDRDWDDWTRIALAEMPDPASEVSRRCVQYQRVAYRRLIDKQLGNWWGAFIGGELVGSLGLFFFGRIGRFQSIVTRADQRNRGVCRTLLTEVAQRAAGMRDRLVIVADESYHALRIYEALGFTREARIGSLCHMPASVPAHSET
ncbi:GNAT family N-acetyltransferase [Trinickia sp. Y13]|uniref:GNAT family N-acetyltransferase n=1 Tax=Trinickia sp. Y13 TaxID=2917807 RepID=UPI0024057E55|nr:GNAT family N-acetyltransferase [Trinickia sp. Y13]MDG0024925.1 GNAT family N-acetyltransferase [Trinickia sp. Y13]